MTTNMEKMILITTTSDDRAELEKIAAHLVENRLAACCQISGPITSWYTWKGELISRDEWVCSIKSVENLYLRIEKTILEVHHYDLPQVMCVEISQTSEAFDEWVRSSTS